MTENETTFVTSTGTFKDQVAKTVLGAIAGLAAGKLVEKAYDATKELLRNRASVA